MPREQTPYRKCYLAALRLLGRREHSMEELRLKLSHRQFDSDDIEKSLHELCRLDYLNDERSADAFARQLHQRGYGPAYMRRILFSKGLAPELIDRAIADYCLEQAQMDACRLLLDKKLRNVRPHKPVADVKRSLYRHLFNRGFCAQVVHHALDEAVEGGE